MRYDAILMDADDTLFDFVRAECVAIERVLAEMRIDDGHGPSIYREINRRCWNELEKGVINKAQLKLKRFQLLGEALGVEIDAPRAGELFEQALSEQAFLLEYALETIERIARERPVAIVTNGIARVQHGRMGRSEVRRHISALLISEEVGAEKPDPRIVRAALEALGGVEPDRALLIGDSLSSDMRAAERAGVDGCWYNPGGLARPDDVRITYEIRDIRQAADIALQ